MYGIAEQVREWLAAGREVTIAQVIETRGFSSRSPGEALAWTDGEDPVGTFLPGMQILSSRRGLHDITITQDAAVAAGLACGGTARVLLEPAAAYPAELWDELSARTPLCLVTPADGAPTVHTAATVRDAGFEIAKLFGRGVSATAVLDGAAVVALWPVPTLVVVGDGLIATALADAAALLGWSCRVAPEVDDAVDVILGLHRSDALVVLSHDRDVDGPALAAALAGDVGYVGALGSRRTQAARRGWLTERSVGGQERIHGPAGLDIDAHTPAEIAISIVAEILATRSGTDGGALRNRSGPVHGPAGVHAPPPRY